LLAGNLVYEGESAYRGSNWSRYRLEEAEGKAALSLKIDAKGKTTLAGAATFVLDDVSELVEKKISTSDVFYLDADTPTGGKTDFCLPLKLDGRKYSLTGHGDLEAAVLYLKAFEY